MFTIALPKTLCFHNRTLFYDIPSLMSKDCVIVADRVIKLRLTMIFSSLFPFRAFIVVMYLVLSVVTSFDTQHAKKTIAAE